jgi:hypothetical protein
MASLHIIPLCAFVALMATFTSSAFGATGAGADDGAAESSVRLPIARETLGPADSASTVKTPISNVQKVKRNGFDELSVSIGDESYVSKPKGAVGKGSYEEVSARMRGKTEKPIFSAAIDAGASVSANVSNYSNVEVPEAYFRLQTPPGDPTGVAKSASITAGRKKERWSGLDSDWSLGLVEPFNKFDALRPTEQGLTGVFAEGSVGAVSLMAFGSNIFIPEQGAPYDLTNGRFTTSSPWFAAPPDQLVLLGQTRNALYNVNMPETASIINHLSYGLRARVAAQSGEGFYAQSSLLRKPMNAITLGFTGQLSIVEGDTYGDVNIYPQVVYDTITAGDIGYTAKNFALGFSVLRETPDQPQMTDGLTTSHYTDMTMLSPSAEIHVLPSKTWGPRLRVAYLTTTGGEVTAVGEYAQNGNVFGPRTIFRRAVSGSFETTLHHSDHWSLDASARWIEELDELGTVVMSDLRLALGDSWRIALQADLLGSRQPTSDTNTFIARYRANDRTAVRLTYLF